MQYTSSENKHFFHDAFSFIYKIRPCYTQRSWILSCLITILTPKKYCLLIHVYLSPSFIYISVSPSAPSSLITLLPLPHPHLEPQQLPCPWATGITMTKPQMVGLSFPSPWRVEALNYWLGASCCWCRPFWGGGFSFRKAFSVIVKEDLVWLNLANKREQAACEHILVSVYKTKWINGEMDQGLSFDPQWPNFSHTLL